MIHIKRVYDKSLSSDNIGYTILVDRLWPRGLRKDEVEVDLWLKDIAPSTQLRRWFAHDPAKWAAFKQRYFAELESNTELVQIILEKAKKGTVCLLYGAKDEKHNNAVALKELLDRRLGGGDAPTHHRSDSRKRGSHGPDQLQLSIDTY